MKYTRHYSVYSEVTDNHYAIPVTQFFAPPRGHRNKRTIQPQQPPPPPPQQQQQQQQHFYTIPSRVRGPLPKILSDLEEKSEMVLCPNCGRFVLTRTKIRRGCVVSSSVVVCLCLLFCLLGLWVCLPCLFWCYNRKEKFRVQHYCSKCDEMLFEYKF